MHRVDECAQEFAFLLLSGSSSVRKSVACWKYSVISRGASFRFALFFHGKPFETTMLGNQKSSDFQAVSLSDFIPYSAIMYVASRAMGICFAGNRISVKRSFGT